MVSESIKTFAIPLSIYIVMGAIITRIQLDKTDTHGYRWLQWMQFGVDVLRILFMWPLVLFIEKSQSWLGTSAATDENSPVTETSQIRL
jgi:hypothetical protein